MKQNELVSHSYLRLVLLETAITLSKKAIYHSHVLIAIRKTLILIVRMVKHESVHYKR